MSVHPISVPEQNERDVLAAFDLLHECGARFYLLRPIDLRETVKDIDVIVPREDVTKLVNLIQTLGLPAKFTTSMAENTIAILVGNMCIDIKTRVCFLHTKFYSFDEPPPFVGIRFRESRVIVPDTCDDRLFTFWILHLFLDKKHPEDSSSYHLFDKYFSSNWKAMMDSEFALTWFKRVWGGFTDEALELMRQFMGNALQHNSKHNEHLRNLVLSRSTKIHLTYHLERIKYGLIRRIKRNLYKPIAAYGS